MEKKKLKIEVVSVQGNSGFAIQKLPLDILRFVACLMMPDERISLALTSNKTENALMRLNFPKTNLHGFHIQDPLFSNGRVADFVINTKVGCYVLLIKCGTRGLVPEQGCVVTTCAKWIDPKCSVIYNARSVYKRIRKLIPTEDGLSIYIGPIKKADVKRVISAEEFDNWKSATAQVINDMASIRFIMKNAYADREFSCGPSIQFPDDFSHENAFKFQRVRYNNARWVRLEQLLTMKGVMKIDLGMTSLTPYNINTLIRHCVENDEPVCDRMEIGLAGIPDEMAVMKGLIHVPGLPEHGPGVYFTCSQSVESPNMAVVGFNNNMVFCTVFYDETEYLPMRIKLHQRKIKKNLGDDVQRRKLEKKLDELQEVFEKQKLSEEENNKNA